MNNQEKEQNPQENKGQSSPQPKTADSRPTTAINNQKKSAATSTERTKDDELAEYEVCQGIKTGASTVAGAGLGVMAGITGIAAAAAIEIVLPVSLCLWAAGVSGGAIGLLLGMDPKKKC